MFRCYKNTGSALITALLILGIAAGIATLIQVQTRSQLLLVKKLIDRDEIKLFSQYADAWTLSYLHLTANQETLDYSTPVPELQKRDMHIFGNLYDMQALFNLNNIGQDNQDQNFIRLMQFINPAIDIRHCEAIVGEIRTLYSGSSTAPLIVQKGELRLATHMTPTLYTLLAPYLTALPQSTKININTAPLPILMTFESLTKEQAETIIDARTKEPFKNMADLEKLLGQNEIFIPIELITLKSSYFLLETRIEKNHEKFVQHTLFKREVIPTENEKPQVNISKLWQSEGAQG